MDRIAAPGRERFVEQLLRVRAALNHRRDDIDAYLTWVAKQEAELPASPAITDQTSWRYNLHFIDKVVAFINYRTDLLRQYGCNLDDTWTVDAASLVAIALQPPRGTEMAQSILKDAAIEVEAMLRFVMRELEFVERTHVWNWVNTLIDVSRECLGREQAPPFLQWHEVKNRAGVLRAFIERQCSQDAVWLQGLNATMTAVEGRLVDDRDWLQALGEHEGIVWELLEEVEELGIKVGGRQTLIPQYFSQV